ncbi:uncharacterized protein CXQ87_001762 [Candidozyma duobushaemuli]|uniref:Cysteine protease n=2 Tax=Candidozyma TaxID=3303203 RepID=A0ABX8I8A2_9ASCO|nr:uncharacterized protein CXQ87_001762 [[Candida] duobushaemulonis]PVH13649.1 hypothetical protein CXQ87_001762 [[Candida] duobushaemulonis]QWU88115.1 hypothetical protein CA3LBN_002380 [[Candida] haemuloni]
MSLDHSEENATTSSRESEVNVSGLGKDVGIAQNATNPQAATESQTTTSDQPNTFQNALAQFWQRLRSPELSEDEINGPVVIMGTSYTGNLTSPEIEHAIQRRLWFTYRTGFEPIPRSLDGPSPLSFLGSMIVHGVNPHGAFTGFFDNNSFKSDVGWGCMIRTAQCLLANTLQTVLVRAAIAEGNTPDWSAINSQVVALFQDSYSSPFSLHNFVGVASHSPLKVKPGQWFGPSAASLSIKRLCTKANENSGSTVSVVPRLNVMICESCDLHDDEIKTALKEMSPLLLLFPIRLGIETINSIYYPSLFQLLSLTNSMGISGGKPSSSYYFFGYQGESLLYLDPHSSQQVDETNGSYKPLSCNTVPISGLDPSMVVGLLVESYDDYQSLKTELQGRNKIVHFHDRAPARRSVSHSTHERSTETDRKGENAGDLSDFVDIGDDFGSEEEGAEDTSHSMAAKYDIVEGPSKVTVLEDEN